MNIAGSRHIERKSLSEYSLADARKGDVLEVRAINDENARIQAVRFGMAEGALVECVTRIPAGPIVVRSGRQEIALGRALARKIRVRLQPAAYALGDRPLACGCEE